MIEIYVNDNVMELDQQSKFYVTYNGFNVFNPSKRYLSFTSFITFPKTKNNVKFCESFGIDFSSDVPYSNLKIRIVEDGFQIFFGRCYLSGVINRITMSGLTEEFDVLSALKEAYVDQLDHSGVGTLTDGTYHTLRNGVDGLFAPVFDHGKFSNIPVIEFLNNNFAGNLDDWIQEQTGADWTYNGTDAQCIVPAAGQSKKLGTTGIVFPAGYKYRVTINFTLSSANAISIITQGKTEIGYDLIDTTAYSSSGAKTLVITFEPTMNYESLTFMGVSSAGNTITIQSFTTPVEVDYEEFIEIDEPFYLPTFGYKRVIDDSIKSFGVADVEYNLSAAQAALIDKLLMSSNNDDIKYSDRFIDKREVTRRANGSQSVSLQFGVTDTDRIEFPVEIKMPYGSWASDAYTVPNETFGYYADVELSIVLDVTATSGNGFRLLIENGATTYSTGNIIGTGRKVIKLNNRNSTTTVSVKGILFDNNTVFINSSVLVTAAGGINSFDVLSAVLTIRPIEYPQDETVKFSALVLPGIKMFDLVKDYLVRTVSLIRFKNNVLEFKPIQNIIMDKTSAVDWTSKRNRVVDDIEFSLSDYAQTNWFQDSELDGINDKISIDLTNENIAKEKTFYQSPFKTAVDESYKGINIGSVKIFEQESQRVYSAFQRKFSTDAEGILSLLKYRSESADDPVVKYGGTTATTYTVANYVSWTEFQDLFFTAFGVAMDKVQVIGRSYNLTPSDINDLDIFKLIYDDHGYYLLINLKYLPKKLTGVVMLKVY